MTYKLSKLSKKRLEGVDTKLKALIEEALDDSPVDFGIAWKGGKRTAKEQKQLYKKGVTTKDGYERMSKHQIGQAVDVLPYVAGQVNLEEKYYYIIIGVVMSTAKRMGLNIRSGGDWDSDGEYVTDHDLKDLPHFELI